MGEYYAARRGLRSLDEDGAAPGDDAPRWPGAPELRFDENGDVSNARAYCEACDSPSTLGYRCSECGNDLATGDSA